MPLCHFDVDAAELSGPKPYLARPAANNVEDWPFWYVAGPDGRRNVLRFPGCGGAVLTSREAAEEIARRGNSN